MGDHTPPATFTLPIASGSAAPVVPYAQPSEQQPNQIIIPPAPQQQPQALAKHIVPDVEEDSSPCCSSAFSAGMLVFGLIMFLIFVTIAGVLGQDKTIFCNGYWTTLPKYQLSGHSTVAVWALIMGSTFFFLGLVCLLENVAAVCKCVGLRDQLRTVVLLTGLFTVAWVITGNVWIIGDENSFGVVPDSCKHGNNGNRNLYHYCLAMLIFFDIALPIALLIFVILSRDVANKSILNKTLFGAAPTTTPATETSAPAAATAMTNENIASSAASRPATPGEFLACCTLPFAGATFVLGLVLFLIFVTIAGALGQSNDAFCNGYWVNDLKYQLGNHSIIAVWALMQGSAFFFDGFLFLLEYCAASMRAIALRDRLRSLLLLSVLFTLAWMIAGNVWILGDENNMGKVPSACKDGAMGNRNLYHYCIAIIIIMDVLIPLGIVACIGASSTKDSVCNRTLCGKEDTSRTKKPDPCCTTQVALFAFVFFVAVFVVFIVVPSILEPGVMSRSWDQTFCNGYWKSNPKYQLSGHSTVAVWALLQGSSIFFLGLLWILENVAASFNLRSLRDQFRTMILLTAFFGFCWMICGNVWVFCDEFGGSNLGVIPQTCKDGLMGNRNLYHFAEAMLIFLDITVPFALAAVAIRTFLNKTLAFRDPAPLPLPVKVAEPVIVEQPKPQPEVPATSTTVFIGQA